MAALEVIPRRAWTVLGLTALGQALGTYAGSTLNVAFPSVLASFDVPRSTLGWALSGYSIASASLLLIAGRLSDRISARRVFLAGVLLFATTCFAAAIAPSVELFIAARTGQGFATALMVPSSLALALREFPESRMSMGVAMWGGLAAISGASSAPVSAVIIEVGSWRWVFAGLGPTALVIFAFGRRFLREPISDQARDSTETRREPLDLLGAPMGAIGVGLVVAVLLKGAQWGWTSLAVVSALVSAALLGIGVVVRSRTHPAPVLDLSLFKIRRFAAASGLIGVYNMATTGYWFATPVFLQTVWGWSVLTSGLAIAAGPLTHLLLARPSGKWADRGNHRLLLILGCGVGAFALGMLAWRLSEAGNYWTDVFPWTVLIGVSGSLSWATFTSAALVDVDPARYGQANGVSLTVRQMGAALGIALAIAVIGDSAIASADDFKVAFAVMAGACVVCAAGLAVLYPRRSVS